MVGVRLETVKDDATECWIFHGALGSAEQDSFLAQFQGTLADITKDHIWHKDPFNVHLPIAPSKELPPHLYSLTYYGDNIEDEWFIVYVLMELTEKFPGVVAQVRDNDGEFLLIEAADALPAWATPDTTENRVFIMNGEIHLIPPSLVDTKTFDVKEALECMNVNFKTTRAADNIQMAIKNRLQVYPGHIKENLHRAFVRLPAKLAAVLQVEPGLVAQAVNAYCSRDSMESNICKKMEVENCVDTCVTFTKCLYAMLIHASELHKASWKLPPKSSDEYKKSILGIKLACGFEILMSKASQDTFASKQWNVFMENLKKNGFFKDNIEGSKDYNKLLDDAKQYFVTNECSDINAYIGNNIKQIMSTTQFKDVYCNITHSAPTGTEDSEAWLNIDPEELNNLMSQRYGKANMFSKSDVISPQTITNQLSSFLKQSSDLEGIELNNEVNEQVGGEHHIEFEYNKFGDCVKNILNSLENENESDMELDTDDSECDNCGEDGQARSYQRAMDEELSSSTLAQSFISDGKSVDLTKNTYLNFLQSIKEEGGSMGPSSNLLSNIGFSKNCIKPLDSDDEDMDD